MVIALPLPVAASRQLLLPVAPVNRARSIPLLLLPLALINRSRPIALLFLPNRARLIPLLLLPLALINGAPSVPLLLLSWDSYRSRSSIWHRQQGQTSFNTSLLSLFKF